MSRKVTHIHYVVVKFKNSKFRSDFIRRCWGQRCTEGHNTNYAFIKEDSMGVVAEFWQACIHSLNRVSSFGWDWQLCPTSNSVSTKLTHSGSICRKRRPNWLKKWHYSSRQAKPKLLQRSVRACVAMCCLPVGHELDRSCGRLACKRKCPDPWLLEARLNFWVWENVGMTLGSEWRNLCHQMVSVQMFACPPFLLWLLVLIHQDISLTRHMPCRQTSVGHQSNLTGKTTHQWCVWLPLSAVTSLCYYPVRDAFMSGRGLFQDEGLRHDRMVWWVQKWCGSYAKPFVVTR